MTNTTNTNITFKGKPLTVPGKALEIGSKAPDAKLVSTTLEDVRVSDFKGKVVVLSCVPSLDTPTCHVQTKRFNTEATGLSADTVVIAVSRDLPFAQKRWCEAEKSDRIVPLSDYKYREFGAAYGCAIEELGLLARAVFVIDREGTVRHVEYVPEISEEPDYAAALEAVRKAC